MNLKCQHAVVRVTDISKARDFYVDKLGLEVLEEAKNFFAAKAGAVRFSFFGGYEKPETAEPTTGVSLIFRTEDLEKSRKELADKGVKSAGDVIDIPNFHKFLEYEDPDGNVIYLGQYYVEPV